MESDILGFDKNDGDYSMPVNEAIKLIEEFMKVKLSHFIQVEKYFDPSGYFGMKYKLKDYEFFIGSGRGYLESFVKINGEEFPFTKFDKKFNHIKYSNKNNILNILNFAKSLFNSN